MLMKVFGIHHLIILYNMNLIWDCGAIMEKM